MESGHVGASSSDVQETADCEGRTAGKFLVMGTRGFQHCKNIHSEAAYVTER